MADAFEVAQATDEADETLSAGNRMKTFVPPTQVRKTDETNMSTLNWTTSLTIQPSVSKDPTFGDDRRG